MLPALTKYYFDVVDQQGVYHYAYIAAVPLLGNLLLYRQFSCPQRNIVKSHFRVVAPQAFQRFPRDRHEISIGGVRATWQHRLLPHQIEVKHRHFHWQLLQVQSPVAVTGLGLTVQSGLGYAERLSLHTQPWKLGITRVLWGRFISDVDFAVWLSTDGETPVRFAQTAQGPAARVEISQAGVLAGPARITFLAPTYEDTCDDLVTARTPAVALLSRCLWGGVPLIAQNKRVIRARLDRAGEPPVHGFAVAESIAIGAARGLRTPAEATGGF
jgi:hypothetical protein